MARDNKMDKNVPKEQRQLAIELHKPSQRRFQTRRTITNFQNDLWQGDLVEMQKLAKQNKGYRYYLAVIDTFSKMGYAEPVKRKNMDDVSEAFKVIIKRAGATPKNLQTDQGLEFFNKKFREIMDKHNINHYNTWTEKKASIVERWNRTIKERLWKLFTEYNTTVWIDMLQDVVDEYNNKKHTSIGMKPIEVNNKNASQVRERLAVSKTSIRKPKFKVGDWVRMSRWYKNIFSKSYEGNWTEELFKIVKVKHTVPIVYELENVHGVKLDGTFYEKELQKTKIEDYFRIGKVEQKRVNPDGTVDLKVTKKGYDQRYYYWIPSGHTENLTDKKSKQVQ